jgi:Tfp pilus assembly protein PilN
MAREKAWAVAIARELSQEIPAAVRLTDLRLTNQQIMILQKAFAARLIATMGEDSDETPRSAANRSVGR